MTMIYPKLITLALYALPTLAVLSPHLHATRGQNPGPRRYIVILNPGQEASDARSIETFPNIVSSESNITHRWEHLNAFAGYLTEDDLDSLKNHPHVNAIEEDVVMTAYGLLTQCAYFPWSHSIPRYADPTKLDQDRRPVGFESNLFQSEAC